MNRPGRKDDAREKQTEVKRRADHDAPMPQGQRLGNEELILPEV
jgi:hypothetical protein